MTGRKMVMLLFLYLILSLTFTNTNAEENEPSEVLIGNELRDIAMDADYVWIATEKGVNRYDRKADEWKFYTVADGLVSNLVNCIAPERVEGILTQKSGNEVWFGTDSGVSMYDKTTDSWRSYTTRDGLIYNKVNAISARGDDVWIGTDKGVSVYDKKKDAWTSYSSFPGIPTNTVTAIYHESAYAWIGTQDGLARYSYRHKKWEYFRTKGSAWLNDDGAQRRTEDSPIPDNRINSIDGEGRYVYIATKSVLVEYDRHAARSVIAERTAYSKLKRARRVAIDSLSKSRWLESGVRTVMSKDRKEDWERLGWRHISIEGLMGDRRHEVSDNFLDVKYRAGEAWVATSCGLIRFDSWIGERQVFTKESGLIDDEVTTVATIGSEIWAGTAHGLGRYSTYRRSWKDYRMEKALPSSFVTTLAEDKDGMWFATRGAVSKLNYEDERWKTFTRDDGLAGNNIDSIAVVGNYVWYGTDEGVSRLSKSTKEWDNFNASKTGLVSDDVTAVLVDGKYIWIGTKAGLSRYDDTTGEWANYSTSSGLLDNYINALAADPQFVWVGTRSGLNRYEKAADKWIGYTTDDGLSSNVITSLSLGKNRVWVATKRGLNSLDRKTWKWTKHTDEPMNAIASEESGDEVWMGGRGRICRYELVTDECRVFADEDVKGLSRVNVLGVQDTPQYVWFATDGGIFRYNKLDGTWWTYSPTKQRGSRDVLVDNSIQAIAGDKDFIYFGTPAGISRYDRMTGNWLNYTDTDGLIGPDVRALLLDGPDLWIGTQSGISRYDTVSDTWTNYSKKDGLPSNAVFSLAIENPPFPPLPKGGEGGLRIWAGTRDGAAFLEKAKSQWEKITTADGLPDNHVWSVAVDSSLLAKGDSGGRAHIWFGTNKGAARYVPSEGSWSIYTADDGLICSAVKSIGFEGKYVFLNTDVGTTIYDKELGSFTDFSLWDGLAGLKVGCMASAKRTEMDAQEAWIGTDGGATHYDLVTDTPDNLTMSDGLASDNIQSIMVDGWDIWFGTDSGVSQYDTLADEWTTFRKAATSSREGQSSGLISFNIKSLAVDDDYLWVGTRSGLSRYDKVSSSWEHFPLIPPAPELTSRPQTESDQIFERVKHLLMGMMPEKAPGIGSPLTGRSQPARTFAPSIRTIALDGKYLWLGSNSGLYMFSKPSKELTGFVSTISSVEGSDQAMPDVSIIRNIGVYEGMVWITCNDKLAGFKRYDSSDSWVFLSDTRIDSEVTADGMNFNTETKDLRESTGLTNMTTALVVGDLIWAGREKGLQIYSIRNQKPVTSIQIPEDISEKKVTAIVSDAGHFWVGTRSGLYLYDSQAREWKLFTKNDGLVSARVSSLAVDDGYVWVGSSDAGVSRYDKSTSLWKEFTTDDGLADNNVRAIAVDGKYVWFGTFSGGVCRYDKTADLWTTYKTNIGRLGQ